MGDLSSWFNNIPFLTRIWFGATIAFSLLARFGLLNPGWLFLTYDFIHKFHIWRPITALFYYPITPQTGFHFLMNLYFLYNYSVRLETGLFAGRPADYLFMLLFMWICCCIVALLANFGYLMDSMVIGVLYVWCQLNKDLIVSYWFGTQFKAMYLPWVLFAISLIIFGRGVLELVGILVAHFYYFLTMKYPQDFGGVRLISTPDFLYSLLPNQRGYTAAFGQAPQYRRPDAGGGQSGLFRGRGHTLGN